MRLKANNFKNKLKYKIINYLLQNGNKPTCEKTLSQSLKLIQKSQKKSHFEIVKLAILNATPVFRVIELKNKRKKRKKKGIGKQSKEIPAFLSHYVFRTSQAIKLISDGAVKRSRSKGLVKQLHQEIQTTSQNSGEVIKFKTETQKLALKKKFYFKYYRW